MKLLLILLCFAALNVSAELYKCKDADGNVTYQQVQCESEEGQSTLKIRKDTTSAYSDIERQLITSHKVAVGMSDKAVIESWGKPTKINRSALGSDQWIYDWGKSGTQYVYVKNGRVVNWSESR